MAALPNMSERFGLFFNLKQWTVSAKKNQAISKSGAMPGRQVCKQRSLTESDTACARVDREGVAYDAV